jgi:hypothetical protein
LDLRRGTLGAHQLGKRQQALVNLGTLHRWPGGCSTLTRWSEAGPSFVRLTVRPNSRARSQIKFDRSWVAEVVLTWPRPIHARVGTGSACRWCSTAGRRMLQALVECPLKRAAVWVRIPPGAHRCGHGQPVLTCMHESGAGLATSDDVRQYPAPYGCPRLARLGTPVAEVTRTGYHADRTLLHIMDTIARRPQMCWFMRLVPADARHPRNRA